MKKSLCLFVFIVLLDACNMRNDKLSSMPIEKDLIGTWYQEDYKNEGENEYWYVKHYFVFGDKNDFISRHDVKFVHGESVFDGTQIDSSYFGGKWSLIGNTLTLVLEKSVDNEGNISVPEESHTDILEIIYFTEDSIITHQEGGYGVLYKEKNK